MKQDQMPGLDSDDTFASLSLALLLALCCLIWTMPEGAFSRSCTSSSAFSSSSCSICLFEKLFRDL